MKCELCHYPEGYHSVTCPEDKSGAAEIIKLTVETVRKHDQQQRVKSIKSRHEWKLRNTRLLLNHYNYFKEHIDESIYCSDQIKTIDLLAEMESTNTNINIQSIKKSAQKTFVIMSHIDSMIDLYRSWCDRAGETEQRRLRVLKMFFFDKIKVPEILQAEFISERTFYRDIDESVNKLSALIFGIEAVNEMAE